VLAQLRRYGATTTRIDLNRVDAHRVAQTLPA
jgi:hypothetical protein